jgi:hypothetical protein
VAVGSRVRLSAVLSTIVEKGAQIEAVFTATTLVEGSSKPGASS